MAIFLIHFVPIILFSVLIIRLISKKTASKSGGINVRPALYILLALVILRPFIIAMWMVSAPWFALFHAAVFLVSIRKKKSWNARFELFVKLFFLLFPAYLCFAILVFSLMVGRDCDLMAKQKGIKPVFSFCDKNNQELAKDFTKTIFHCRNAFYSADRRIVYLGFGAETNQNIQKLAGVDFKALKVDRVIPSNTVFGGYCSRALNTCIHLVTPKNIIRFWDDMKQEQIKTVYLPKDRPRFMSVDVENPEKVYVATDGSWLAEVDLRKNKIEKKIRAETSSVLTVENSRKYVLYTSSLFFQPALRIVDKKTGATRAAYAGRLTMWKNMGFFFHFAVDPDREIAYAAAPFEGAIYAIDLVKNRVLWRRVMPVGIRDMAFDTKRGVLYASNFVNGWVYMINTDGKRPRRAGRLFAGQRIRYINYERDEDILLFASGNGFFAYNPEGTVRNTRDVKSNNTGERAAH